MDFQEGDSKRREKRRRRRRRSRRRRTHFHVGEPIITREKNKISPRAHTIDWSRTATCPTRALCALRTEQLSVALLRSSSSSTVGRIWESSPRNIRNAAAWIIYNTHGITTCFDHWWCMFLMGGEVLILELKTLLVMTNVVALNAHTQK